MSKIWLKSLGVFAFSIVITACGNDDIDQESEEAESGDTEETSESGYNDAETIVDDDFMVIAHRGASGYAPEQTVHALDLAVEMDTDYLELDVQKTADDELVVFHDDDISRTTDGEGEIGDHTLDELKELDAGSWFNEEFPDAADESYADADILSLEEVIERYGNDEMYYIETKSPEINEGMEEPLVEILEEHGVVDEGNAVIQSFSQESLQTVRDLNEDIPLVQLLWWEEDEESGELEEWMDVSPKPEEMSDEDFAEIRDYAVGIGPHLETDEGTEVIDEEFIEKAQNNDLLVHVYTINEEEDMQQLIDWGVNGILTDFPDRLHEVLENE